MDRWAGQIAVVTGASSGIGKAIAESLVKHGMKVVGLARRVEKMKQLAEEFHNYPGEFLPIECDVTKEEHILRAFQITEDMGGVSVLVNNAGITFPERIIEGNTENFQAVLDVNVLAVAICSREAAKSLRSHNRLGHIININSVLGLNTSKGNAPLSLYQASKYAVTAMSEVVRKEAIAVKAKIKVTNLAPGLVKTDMPIAIGGLKIFGVLPYLEPKDIADAVIYALGTPENVEVTTLEISPLGESLLEPVDN